MRRTLTLILVLVSLPTAAAAQEMSSSDRARAVSRVRSIADCLSREDAEMQRILRLIGDLEEQRDHAREARVRSDAEAGIEALVARAAEVQGRARTCVGGESLPSPGTQIEERGPDPDAAAESVAESGGTVRVVEQDARLADMIHVVRGEQVDGQGQLDAGAVRSAIRRIVPRLERCYEQFLRNGSASPAQLDLVFGISGGGRARAVDVERSGFGDATFERCVRSAGQGLTAGAPRGGDATFSYTLRFGRAPSR